MVRRENKTRAGDTWIQLMLGWASKMWIHRYERCIQLLRRIKGIPQLLKRDTKICEKFTGSRDFMSDYYTIMIGALK